MSNMKTFQTKRAAKLFDKWWSLAPNLRVKGQIYYYRNCAKSYDCGYHALRDLIREFCEGRGSEITKIHGKWYVQDIHSRELTTGGFRTIDLAYLAALEKALETKP